MSSVYDEAWRNEQIREMAKGYRGCTHLLNKVSADFDECWKAIVELREQNASLLKDREADRAKIGELQTRLDRQAEFLNTLREKPKRATA